MPTSARQLSMSRLGHLTPVPAWHTGAGPAAHLEIDGVKRVRAAQALSWPSLRVEVHTLDAAGAKVRLPLCNTASGLSDLEIAWVVRSLYREDKIDQPQIAQLLGHDKSWVNAGERSQDLPEAPCRSPLVLTFREEKTPETRGRAPAAQPDKNLTLKRAAVSRGSPPPYPVQYRPP